MTDRFSYTNGEDPAGTGQPSPAPVRGSSGQGIQMTIQNLQSKSTLCLFPNDESSFCVITGY